MALVAQHGLEYRIMATLGCSAAEQLLRVYLQAIRGSNKANQDYLRAMQNGAHRSVQNKAKVARDSIGRLQAAREAFQEHRRKHLC
jgi:hypothetical protein